jgi:hypothetical protein
LVHPTESSSILPSDAEGYVKLLNQGTQLVGQMVGKGQQQQRQPVMFAPSPARPRQPLAGGVPRMQQGALDRYLRLMRGGM